MRQRNDAGPMFSPGANGLGYRVAAAGHVVCLGELTNDESELQRFKRPQQLFTPGRCALRAWRKIAGLAGSRIAEAHGQDGHLLRVIENLSRHAQPIAEAVATRVCERRPDS